MSGKAIVVQLQEEAVSSASSMASLLRKALVVATKLELVDFRDWIDAELNGYDDPSNVPEYRRLRGQLKGWNPFHGWIPVNFEDDATGEAVRALPCTQSIPELEHLLNTSSSGTLCVPASDQLAAMLNQGELAPTHFQFFISASAVANIVSAVQNALLGWALQLEADGVLGDGLTFSDEEKRTALAQSYNVNNFYGEVGAAVVRQGAHDIEVAPSAGDISRVLDNLTRAIDALELDGESRGELDAEVATTRAQLASPRPKDGVIRGSLATIQRILEGASGNAAGTLLVEVGRLLAG